MLTDAGNDSGMTVREHRRPRPGVVLALSSLSQLWAPFRILMSATNTTAGGHLTSGTV